MMRTAEEWVALDDLPVELAKVFTPGPWKHAALSRLNESGRAWCRKCERWIQFGCESPKPCFVPDPINIKDWTAAKYWQGKCDRDKWYAMMEELYYAIPEDICRCPWEWIIFDAQPKHYLIAAAMAAGRST